jgi:hypothetical protein
MPSHHLAKSQLAREDKYKAFRISQEANGKTGNRFFVLVMISD